MEFNKYDYALDNTYEKFDIERMVNDVRNMKIDLDFIENELDTTVLSCLSDKQIKQIIKILNNESKRVLGYSFNISYNGFWFFGKDFTNKKSRLYVTDLNRYASYISEKIKGGTYTHMEVKEYLKHKYDLLDIHRANTGSEYITTNVGIIRVSDHAKSNHYNSFKEYKQSDYNIELNKWFRNKPIEFYMKEIKL